MDRRPLTTAASSGAAASSSSSSLGVAGARPSSVSASLPMRRPSGASTAASAAPTPSGGRGTLERRPSSVALSGGSASSIPRPGGVPATPSSRIPFGSKRTLASSSGSGSGSGGGGGGEEPPSVLRRTNTSMALQVDLERRLAAAEERERDLERQVEERRREAEDVRNMMRLLVADEETRQREADAQKEQQAAELSQAQRTIHELRSTLSSSEANAGALASQIANLQVELSRAQSSFEAEMAELVHQLEASDDDAQLAREKCERAEGERESMRRRLGELTDELEGRRRDEGEREGAAVMREELKRQSSILSSQDAQLNQLRSEVAQLRSKRADQSARVAELESEVDRLTARCDELEAGTDRAALERELGETRRLLKAREEEVNTLQAETASFSTFREKHTSLSSELALLKEEAAALQASHDLLERRVAIGEYDPRSFRCLQLELNPSTMDLAIRTATLEALRAENAALIDQLRREGGTDAAAAGGVGGDGGGVVPRETYDRVMKERQEEKAQMEKRLMRLKEVFKAKSQEFLDTLHSLLGYRILFSESGDVRLNTTYAPRGKSGVTFRFASQEGHFGSMSLTGGLAKTLDELREFWVTQRQEVPCFLASVTLELYDRSTRGKAAGWVRPMDDEDE